MKRIFTLILALICISGLTGCRTKKTQAYFNATVLEQTNNTIKVTCVDAFQSGISVGSEVIVSTDIVAANGVPEITVGDNIRVVFNGEIQETYPLQLGRVYNIYLLDETGEAIPNN